jgi:hypothetical protein
MSFVQSGALPSLNIQILGFKRHLLKKLGFYLQESSMFLIIKKKKEKKTHSSFPHEPSEVPPWPPPLCQTPVPFISHSKYLIIRTMLMTTK